ncbi:hypothetical protein COV19_04695 [Candidatus Woesearchaeota archaeon CG10_big_fil_rev_8_21_14_0_10_44_13]|nr:MAG: hypothetical protein COV19_04695 [Candidatus Woesearchaeota archaeon CG10_big_fil_rev_8_21_14_0_10_44_13]
MGKKGFFAAALLAIFLLEPFLCSAIKINEIMYNPAGDDNNKEFIEVYMEQWTNLSGWTIGDSSSNDTLTILYYSQANTNYALIAEEGFNLSGIDATVYSAGATIGNNLDNSADSVYLYDSNKALVVSASYDGALANGNGRSVEYDNENDEWHESCYIGGSPGMQNCEIIINQTDPPQNQTPENQTNETIPSSEECKAFIVAYTDKEMYNITDKVSIHFALYNDSFPYKIEYWIEDSIGNIVKSKYNTTNTNTKTWTPELDEKDGIFYLKSGLYLDCGNETKTADAESMFIVLNDGAVRMTDSSLSIEEVYTGSDNKIEFGQVLKIKAEVYKGDESSSTVSFWVENDEGEKVSQATSALFYNKFTKYDITMPLQLKPNCNNAYRSGTYTVVAEGFDARDEKPVDISGITKSLCPISSSASGTSAASASAEKETSGPSKTETKISYQLLNFKNKLEPKEQVINELLIQNDDETHVFDVWSYVYRGSKSYSGEREGNKQSIELSPYESAVVELENSIENANPGEYNLKVKVKKDNQKTNYEMTEDVEIVNNTETHNQTAQGAINGELKGLMENRTGLAGNVVYEGSAAKSKKLSFIFLIASIFLISIMGLRNWIDNARAKKGRKQADKAIKMKENI